MIPILILAAGQSTRMLGRDKLLEQIDGIPLLRQRALAALNASDQVFVTLPGTDHPRHQTIHDLPVTIVAVPDAATGMAASLRRGVAALPDCNHFMVLLADLPEVTSADIAVMMAQINGTHLIFRGTSSDGSPGHPLIFHAILRPLFATLTGDKGAKDIISSHPTKLIALPGQHATRDLDTPDDWANWQQETQR